MAQVNAMGPPEVANARQGNGNDVFITATVTECKHLLCSECGFLLKDAVQSNEFRLCQKCFDEIKKLPGGKSKKNPEICVFEDGKEFCFPDKAVRREIEELKLMCTSAGCGFVGTRKEYDQHLTTDISCQHCGTKTVQHLLQDHYVTCCKYPWKCGLCNNFTGIREQMPEHKEKCPKVMCTFDAILNIECNMVWVYMNFHLMIHDLNSVVRQPYNLSKDVCI